jgi:hypothetical protein
VLIARAADGSYRGGMSTPRSAGGHRLISRAAIAGMIAGIAALAAGVILVTTSGPTASDDSPSVMATLVLLFYGPAVAVASAVLRGGEALRWRAVSRHARRHPPLY